MELDILRCGYFIIGIPTMVTWAGSLFFSFCLIFSNFSRQRKITHVSSSPCCNLKWKYRLDFAFHGIFTSETPIENVMNASLYMYVLKQNLKMPFCNKTQNSFLFISFDKVRMINVFIKTVLPWGFQIWIQLLLKVNPRRWLFY